MEVNINHQKFSLDDKATLLQLLEKQGLSEKKGIAVAVNNTVVPRAAWQAHVLNADDAVTVIKATQGG